MTCVTSMFAFQLQCTTYLVFHRLLFFSFYRFLPLPLFPFAIFLSSVVFHSMLFPRLFPSTKFSLYPPLILSRLPISSMLTYFVDKQNSRCEWQIRKIPWNKQKELNFIAIYIHRASKTIFADLLFPLSWFACSFIADSWSWGQHIYISIVSFKEKYQLPSLSYVCTLTLIHIVLLLSFSSPVAILRTSFRMNAIIAISNDEYKVLRWVRRRESKSRTLKLFLANEWQKVNKSKAHGMKRIEKRNHNKADSWWRWTRKRHTIRISAIFIRNSIIFFFLTFAVVVVDVANKDSHSKKLPQLTFSWIGHLFINTSFQVAIFFLSFLCSIYLFAFSAIIT